MKYRFKGTHPGAVTAALTPPSREKLAQWAKESSRFGGGDVRLHVTPECYAALRLTPEVIADEKFWEGDTFTADGSLLDCRVEAESLEACYAVLKKHLFRLQDDRASYAVSLGGVGARAFEGVNSGGGTADVWVFEVVPQFAGENGMELLTVRVTPEEGAAANWTVE